MFSQYGEEQIINKFFSSKTGGVLVDVGAMDGVTYSNSRELILNYGWGGVLVEPHPEYFNKLTELYINTPSVNLKNVACAKEEGDVDFYIYSEGKDSCVSTISKEFKKRVIRAHGNKFKEPIRVKAITLHNILSEVGHVDFLSVDCEGVDMDVLRSNDWTKYRPTLVCVEHSMDEKELEQFVLEINYSICAKTIGNTFFSDKG